MSAGYFFTAFTGHSTANVINEDAEQMEIIIPLSNFGDIDLKDLSTELTQTTQFRVESPEGEGVFLYEVLLTPTYTLTDENCIYDEEDLSFSLSKVDGTHYLGVIENEQVIEVENGIGTGTNTYELTIDILNRQVCGGEYGIKIDFIDVTN